ncbi:hypothetical protein [Spirosoma sp. KCTC 42546]|uniref:hypothetical protein n=1 Tax=Spirosoma sp. KCTC 42546 TaxID=2520506 RepID=UPI001FEEBA72|nr:hypothetical protein [Spirosoma sp. KCTC 42546]
MKGFVNVIEQKWQEFDCEEQMMEATYEATESLTNQLCGQRLYKEREMFLLGTVSP